MEKIVYFLRTIYDIGLVRISGRINNEIRKFIYKYIPARILLIISNSGFKTPLFKKKLENLELGNSSFYENTKLPNKMTFNFLNDQKVLKYPIDWNSNEHNQLWRFNLHYFDWAREWLEIKIRNGEWPKESKYLKFYINDWVLNNRIGVGDGWHSYTISIRVRNWILLFRACPDLLNERNLNSLWQQICWLNFNKEDYLGGNHWLENLITLIIGSLQFEGKRSNDLFKKSIRKLEDELKRQILSDGGHEERSATYHLLILDRLVELGLILENINGERPKWLTDSVFKMTKWAKSIRLKNGSYPLFNDSPDICESLDNIVKYSDSYLNKKIISKKGIKNNLSKIYNNLDFKKVESKKINKKISLIKLLDTGWVIARVENKIELVFKVGNSCPKHLPAHAHSDLLSFELFRNGIPLINETGTSIYGNHKDRFYERSGQAHNVLQLAPYKKNKKETIKWIESIQVWGNFRAARKAKILESNCGYYEDGSIWIEGSNDSNMKVGAKHKRIINLKIIDKDKILFELVDKVSCNKNLYWRQSWHLGPKQSIEILKEFIKDIKSQFETEEKWIDSWHAIGFGKRIKRKTLHLSGVICPGVHEFRNKLILNND